MGMLNLDGRMRSPYDLSTGYTTAVDEQTNCSVVGG